MQNRGKRAQVALIIIIAIVLVVGVILVVLFRSGDSFRSGNFEEIGDIDRAIRECFNQRTIDAARLVGLQGGYVNLPEDHYRDGDNGIAYGVRNGEDVLISVPELEDEIARYLEITMPFCLEDEFVGLDITLDIEEADIKVRDDFVDIDNLVFVSASKEIETFTMEDSYEVTLKINLGNMHDAAEDIVSKHVSDPEFVDLSYLTSLNYDVAFVPIGDGRLIYTITDYDNELQEVPYSFVFVVG